MNGRDIMYGLNYISRKYIDEAEYGILERGIFHGKYAEKPVKPTALRKILLIVAVIALTALLVGCGVVYVLRIQNLKIGQTSIPVTQYDDPETPVSGTEASLDVFSLQGVQNSPSYLAAQEWFDFTQNYVFPGGEYWESEPDYWAYNVLNQEMVDKLDAICEKYGLKIIGKPWHEHSDCTTFLELAGVQSLVRADSGAEVHLPQGRFFPGGSFNIYGTLTMPETEQTLTISYSCIQKDVLYDVFGYLDSNTVTQRNYTTKDGVSLLLLESEQNGMILADRENCFISLSIDGTDGVTLEDIAEQFDFTITPHALDASAADAREQASLEEMGNNGYDPDYLQRPTYKEYVEDLIWSDNEAVMSGCDPSEISRKEYAFYDLDGNGKEEMILFSNDHILCIVGIKDGKTNDGKYYNMDLYEGNVLIDNMILGKGEEWYHIFTFANDGDPVFSNPKERSIVRLKKDADGQWWRTSTTDHYAEFDTRITEEEAMAILHSYQPLKLETRPLTEFEEP